MPRHVDWEIQLHLETVEPNDLSNNKDDYFEAIEDRCDALHFVGFAHPEMFSLVLAWVGVQCKVGFTCWGCRGRYGVRGSGRV